MFFCIYLYLFKLIYHNNLIFYKNKILLKGYEYKFLYISFNWITFLGINLLVIKVKTLKNIVVVVKTN